MNRPLKPLTEAPSVATPQVAKRRSRTLPIALSLFALLILAGTVWWSRQDAVPPAAGRNAGVVSIVPAAVAKGDIGINLNALGTVTSLATVTVRTQVNGQLTRIAFKEGQDIKKGDLVAEVDPRPYEAVLAQMKGQLARDEALLKGARVDVERYQGLVAQNAIPRQTFDTQVALVAQYEGTVEADRAQVRSAEVNLLYCHILSPLDGRVGLRQVDQGNYVTPGDANGLVVITQLQPISVLFTLPEDNLQAVSARLRGGATLPVIANDRSGANKIADGVLQTFDSQIDPATGTIKLRALFSNEERTLYPNQFVNVGLLVDTRKDVTVMPAAGIQRGVPGTFVYLVNSDNTVTVRKVALGATDGERVEVRSGLVPGNRIVVDGADKLRDGAKINVRTAADASKPPQPGQSGDAKPRADGGQMQ